jgi:hypothetical protein
MSRTLQRWQPPLGMPIYQPALRDRSAILAFYDELERWISRPLPAREEDAVLNAEIVLQVLKDMSGVLGNISGLASQMELWPESLPEPIEFSQPGTAPKTSAYAASAASRGAGLVLAFRPRKAVLHSDSMVFEGDVGGLIDEVGSAPGLRNSIANEASPDVIYLPGEKDRVQEVTDAIFIVHGTGQAVTRQVKPDEG